VPYTAEQVRALIAAGESQTVELKAQLREARILARLISAFGNARGGVVLVGVGDQGEILGTDLEEVRHTFHRALSETLAAPPVELEAVTLEGKQIAAITIGTGTGPVLSNEGAFVRVGDKLQPMSVEAMALALSRLKLSDPAEIQPIAIAIHAVTESIERLQRQIAEGSTIGGQMRNYVVGGIIGAVLGLLLSKLLG